MKSLKIAKSSSALHSDQHALHLCCEVCCFSIIIIIIDRRRLILISTVCDNPFIRLGHVTARMLMMSMAKEWATVCSSQPRRFMVVVQAFDMK